MTNFNEKLKKALEPLNIEINEEKIALLAGYYDILVEVNSYMNLTSKSDIDFVVEKHIVDSLTMLEFIPDGAKVIDIGSGAGFPGLILAIARHDASFTLVDSIGKKCDFLRNTAEKLGLKNVQVLCDRAENLGVNKGYRENFDIATARGVINMACLAEYLLPLTAVGGKVIAMKGKNHAAELKEGENAIRLCGGKYSQTKEYQLSQGEERALIVIAKTGTCNKKYPRGVGQVAKSPL